MSALSDAHAHEQMKWATGQTNSLGTAPTPYMRLWTTLPAADGTGGVEVVGGAYAAKSSAGSWAAPSGRSVSTNADLVWATPTADWGTVVGATLETAASGGDMLYIFTFSAGVTVTSGGDPFRIPSGNLTITAA